MEQPQLEHVLTSLPETKFYPSGSNHFSLPCLVGHKHEKGYDSSPSMTVSFGFGKSWAWCFACGHKRPLTETLIEASKHNGVYGPLVLLATKYESETRLEANFEPVKVVLNDYTIPYMDMLERPLPSWALEFLETKGVNKKTAEKFGVTWVEKGYSDDWTGEDMFGRPRTARDRAVVVPVLEKVGTEIVCRGTQARYFGEGTRYLPLHKFPSSKIFFGEQYLENMKGKYTFLVEGPYDAMHLIQEGVLALGLFGTSLSKDKIITLKKLQLSRLYLALDPDIAGRKAAGKIKAKLNESLIPNQLLDLTQDPKYYSKQQLKDLIDNVPLFKQQK